ncbi:MAG: hypothetical protein L0H59_15580, partial [Tomitella sp.]|nr:hypothetical protein [Tomitella sp.]
MSEPATANLTREETAVRSAQVTVHAYRVELDVTGAAAQLRGVFPTTAPIDVEAEGGTWRDV